MIIFNVTRQITRQRVSRVWSIQCFCFQWPWPWFVNVGHVWVLPQGHRICKSPSPSTGTTVRKRFSRAYRSTTVAEGGQYPVAGLWGRDYLNSIGLGLLAITSCAARWPPQYAPAPWPWLLTFWPWSRCGSRMWPGVPLCKVSSS